MSEKERSTNTGELKEKLGEIHKKIRLVKSEIAKVFIGPDWIVEALLTGLLSRGHVLLEGVPGVAKTTLVKAFAQTLDCLYKRIQFTPDLLPTDITGTYILNMRDNNFVLRKGPIFANIVLGDEINRAPAKTQSALLEAMQESHVTIEGVTCMLDAPFMVLATQNPVEQEGVYLLPEAQLDRFLIKVNMGYPSFDNELLILNTHNSPLDEVKRVLSPEEIIEWSRFAEQVYISEELMVYIIRLVRFTRQHRDVVLGASPRASISLLRCAKALSLLKGRDYVLPDDIRYVAPLVLSHRIILKPEAEMEDVQPEIIVRHAITSVPYDKKSL